MNSLSGLSRSIPWSLGTVANSVKTLSISSKVLAVAGLILMGCGTAAAAPLQRRYDGGVIIKQPDFYLLKPLVPEFGPFYSPEFSCRTQNELNAGVQSFFGSDLLSDLFHTPNSIESDPETAGSQIPSEILPYYRAAEDISPPRARRAKRFPDNLSAFMFVGKGLVENGNKACWLNNLKFYTACEIFAEILKRGVSEKVFKAQMNDENSYRGQGFGLNLAKEHINKFVNIDPGVPLSNIHVNFGINPEIHTNYKLALTELEKNVLGDDCFFRKEPAEILEFVKRIHKILMNNIPATQAFRDANELPGEFRKTFSLVFRKTLEEDEKALIDHFEKRNEPSQVNLVKNAFMKLKLDFSLSREEKAIIETTVFLPPPVEDIQKLMDSFAVKFKQFTESNMHPIALAAWVHMQIGNIHPFVDGNGRTARLFLNTILARGGYEPVIFLDHDEYAQAVIGDRENPGTFAAYLVKEMEQQASGFQLLAKN